MLRIRGWFSVVAAGTLACGDGPVSVPPGTTTVTELTFVRGAVPARTPLVLIAAADPADPIGPERVLVTLSSGQTRAVTISPVAGCVEPPPDARSYWAGCSDEALTLLIHAADGRVFIGFKEAWEPAGVDGRGTILTSNATRDRMTRWLRELGVTITRGHLMPGVAAVMRPLVALLHRLRHHPNIDYVEPIFPGTRHRPRDLTVFLPPSGLAAVIPTGGISGLFVEPGDTVTATYYHPDGTRLVAQASITD